MGHAARQLSHRMGGCAVAPVTNDRLGDHPRGRHQRQHCATAPAAAASHAAGQQKSARRIPSFVILLCRLRELRAVPTAVRGTRFPGIQMFIDPDTCTDCGACLTECPVAAIYIDDEVPGEHRADIERNAAFFRDRRSPASGVR